MKWFTNLKIGIRIVIGFLLVALIAGIIGGIGILSLQRVNGSYSIAYTDSVNALEYVERISSSFQRIRMNTYGVVLAYTVKDKEYHIERLKNFEDIISENLDKYKEMLSSYKAEEVETELALIDTLQKGFDAYKVANDNFSNGMAMDSSRDSNAYELLKNGGEIHKLALAVDNCITELINYNINYADNQILFNGAEATKTTNIMVIVLLAGIVIAITTGLFISRGISKPVGLLVKAADNLAMGNIDIKSTIYTKDEIGKLAESFRNLIASTREQVLAVEKIADADLTVDVAVKSENDLMGKKLSQLVSGLNEIMANINSASDQVAAGSRQISDSSMALSQGATEQASSIEELTASIEEISSQTKQNAQNANQANELAENAKSNAVQGNTQMREMLKAMEEINESSANISKVIKVIDDIAFQTNMLALNAAVEAARAGQHGKGFAVVAEEVKNLATRSANAAKETTEMIEGSIKKSEGGTKIAKDTADALDKIVNEIEKVASLVSNIAAASNEQDAGITQINQGVMQVSEVVQNNSATSEESAAASEELSSQAELLKDLVDKFKLKKDTKPHSNLEKLSPEVLKMLDEMTRKTAIDLHVKEDASEFKTNTKIKLSDKEFGKY